MFFDLKLFGDITRLVFFTAGTSCSLKIPKCYIKKLFEQISSFWYSKQKLQEPQNEVYAHGKLKIFANEDLTRANLHTINIFKVLVSILISIVVATPSTDQRVLSRKTRQSNDNPLANILRSLLAVRPARPRNLEALLLAPQSDITSLRKYLRSAKPDESHRSIQSRNRYIDKIDDIDFRNKVTGVGPRVFSLYLDSLLNRG